MRVKIEPITQRKVDVGDIIVSPSGTAYLICKENKTDGKYYARCFDGRCLANSYKDTIEGLMRDLEGCSNTKFTIYSRQDYELKLVPKGE